MALPPTIPTSFVPRPASAGAERFRANSTGIFAYIAYAILGLSVFLAIGVFAYGWYLSSAKDAKDAALAEQQARIDMATVQDFVRLRNRLVASDSLMNGHLAFSGFFGTLETLLPSTARLSTLHVFVDNSGAVRAEGTGVARSFNVLAAVSSAFAKDGRIKDAIFSNIMVSPKDSSVSFTLTAALDPKLVAFTAAPSAPAPSATAPTAPGTTTPPL